MSGIMAVALAGALGSLSVTVSPPAWSSAAHTPFLAGPFTSYVAGGSGSYTYSWTRVIDFIGIATITAPAAAATNLNLGGVPFGETVSGTLTLAVLDTITGLSASVDVPFSHERT